MVTVPNNKHVYERRLGRTILHAYRDTVDLYTLLPNNQQPRQGPKEDAELQRQIVANEGIFEPLLVEPHPEVENKLRIIDGDRRWTNSKVLVEVQKKEQYRTLPVEVIERTLSDDERLRVWVYIHRQRKEWDAREKEMVAYNLVDLVGRASAANILGITVRALDKLVEVYELSESLKEGIPEPSAAITWAREINSLSKKLLTPTVRDTLIQRINEKEITNSKDIRKLRKILRDPVARDALLDKGKSIDAALLRVAPKDDAKAKGLEGDIDSLNDAIKRQPWTELSKLRGNAQLLAKLEDIERTLGDLRKAIASK